MIYILLVLQIVITIFGLIRKDDTYFMYSIALFLGILILKTVE